MNKTKSKISKAKMVAPSDLVPHPRNPNTHSPEQVAAIQKVLSHQGWRAPIVVSKRSGFVISGHGRLAASIEMGLKDVPVDYQEFSSEAEEWAHMIADNRLASMATMNSDQLVELLGELESGDDEGRVIEMEAAGFTKNQFDELAAALKPMEYNTSGVTDYGDNPVDKKFESEYAASSIRQIVLLFDVDEYEEITTALDKIKESKTLETNTDAVAFALRECSRSQ
mgnify:CR=1 FL=1|tara:strand:+ start:56 stop:730 length:675 start_codon:yes stop_codon:yes gene_type:complete